jgi:hypothetical protein
MAEESSAWPSREEKRVEERRGMINEMKKRDQATLCFDQARDTIWEVVKALRSEKILTSAVKSIPAAEAALLRKSTSHFCL